jgi:hypothetical protein
MPPDTYLTDPFPLATDLGDIDGDGDLDWITSSFSGDWFVYENTGQGLFALREELPSPSAASCALLADLDGDGDLDAALIDELADVVLIQHNDGATATIWNDRGNGLAGSSGTPVLTGSGNLLAGESLDLDLSGALPSSLSFWFVGFAALNLPFKGGTLVPAVDFLVFLPTDPAGELAVSVPLSASLPPGTEVLFQVWQADPGGPAGFSASNAVRGLVP